MSMPSGARFCSTNAFAGALVSNGLAPGFWVQKQSILAHSHASVHARVMSGELPFLRLHEDDTPWNAVRNVSDSLREWAHDLVVLGIGGSSLGGRALISALGATGMRVHFPDNLDPEQFGDLLDTLDLQRTAFNVVSKSGGTLETMVQFLVVRDRLRDQFGPSSLKKHLVVTTDPEHGLLRPLADEEGLTTLAIPPGVGGRFSVFTPVGLLPAACAGLDLDALRTGVAKAAERCQSNEPEKNPALAAAAIYHAFDAEHARPVLVTVPYATSLKSFGEWFVQLWAESLGKDNRGPIPITAVGATDQHSQLQLWMQGPHAMVINFVEVEAFRRDIKVGTGGLTDEKLTWASGNTMGHILNTELRATEQALSDACRPNVRWTLPSINAENLAELMVLWEAMTAYAGELYGVNTFDQPGVEAGKVICKRLLREG